MSTRENLFLVGPMGAGKSTVGRRLAQALGMDFHDCDREIERQTGASIPLIFELEGEAGFRRREKEMLERLTALPGVVLATGGGAVLDPDNRSHLSQRGRVIYLHTSVKQQLARTSRDQNRPLLDAADPEARLQALTAERDPLYREIADLVVDTDGRSVGQVVNELLQRLGLERAAGANKGQPSPGERGSGRRRS